MIVFTTKNNKRIIVTSALPYANGPLHVGHLVEYIQTDIFVRFLKLTGQDVLYCCADDTHGTPIELKAKELDIEPEKLIADVHMEHKRDFAAFLVEFDSYYSTNSPENKHFSDLFFERLKKAGHIYTKDIEVTYCEHDKRTLPDRYVKGTCPKCNAADQYGDVCEKCNSAYKTVDLIDPYCTICKNKPVRKISNHYFFKLSAFSDKLEKWLTESDGLQQETKNFALNWIKTGLEDWNISRDGPYFGFKIPGEEDKYYYVWLDAPIGYIASFAHAIGSEKTAEQEWNDSTIVHFIGKDIMYFHLLFWPAMLLGAGFNLPKSINVHGFLTVNGEKMSKSRGTFLTAQDFLQKYNPEYLRFYYASMLSKKLADIDLNFNVFRDKINNELVANLGNFCNRVISFTNKNFDGVVKEKDSNEGLEKEILNKVKRIEQAYSELNFNEAMREILAISTLGNQYFQSLEPWKLVKEDKERVQRICCLCINIIRNLNILITPILPNISRDLSHQLNLSPAKWNDIGFSLKDHKLNKEKLLVEKMEEIAQVQKFPLNLKVAKILSVEDHPNADKLYVLQLDVGAEKRQLVAGLRAHYTKEQLTGKHIVIISNLKYAKLRGVESQGMLLAGDDGENVGVLTTDAVPGTIVSPSGIQNSSEQLTYEEFAKLTITVKDGKPVFEEKNLFAGTIPVTVEKARDGARVK
ncbi:MAG TPA: methionine--tRNA ligase [Candidatus Nanoarchaeia archaeon]|nr:methionine--tRNA ligase [Candidatus Nanoarchaeia archaeon]